MKVYNLIKKEVKKTPIYSIYYRARHFKNHTFPYYQSILNLYINHLKRQIGLLEIKKPIVVNLNANDICNSKCVMCNIWEQKQDFELDPTQLESILKNSLFSEVKHVGITGGEPTLREDLPKLYEAVIKAIPNIKGLSIITNAIKEKEVIKRVEEVANICNSYNKQFSMMVSLDGCGDVHDAVRGRKGNFNSAISVIKYFKEKKIDITVGCTISKINAWDADDLLFYLKKENIYGRFRIAEFIKRLYNDEKYDVIRNFDEDEIYNLTLFFHKLLHYEKNNTFRRTYKSIINILNGGKRLIACPYQTEGIVLNSKGEIAYCAPKSPIIGNSLKTNALNLYQENNRIRKEIFKNDCDNCIHDYHAPETFIEYKNSRNSSYWKNKISLDTRPSRKDSLFIKPKRIAPKSVKQILILGWYGTETVGDKAILGGIISDLNENYDNYSLIIASIFPFVTIRTCKELNINAKVIHSYSKDFVSFTKGSDIIIMGGGPLMDLEELDIPLHSFYLANKLGKETIIYGCGLGPFKSDRYISAVKQILQLASKIKLRDQKSITYAKTHLKINAPMVLSGDPAKIYLGRYNIKNNESKVLRCYLRDWTFEYAGNLDPSEFTIKKMSFENALSQFIKIKFIELGATEIRFEHMHNFVVGNDDRDFSRYFIDKYFSDWDPKKISYNKYLSTVDQIVDSMQNSLYNICMRFHSVVFAHTLKSNFVAIDYTLGGKIHSYLHDNNCLESLYAIDTLLNDYND